MGSSGGGVMATARTKESRRRCLQEAKYTTGRAPTSNTPRCDECRHVDPKVRIKQHGRYCLLHLTQVSTHGGCVKWEAA